MTTAHASIRGVIACLTPWVFSLAIFDDANAERPNCNDLLPSKTLAYVRIADVKELAERLDETSLGRMMKEQQLKSLTKQLFEDAEAAFQSAAEELGLTIRELLQIPQGEITLAVVQPPNGLPAVVLMMDIAEQESKVQKIWDLVDSRLPSGFTRTTEDVHDTALTIFAQDDPRWTGLVRFQKEGMQVVSSNLDVAKQILAAWHGDAEQAVLAGHEDFADVMRRSKGPRAATPQIRWFVDPISLAKVSSRGNLGAQTALAVLPVVGADGLLALGGSMTFATDEYDWFVQAHMITAEPRSGVLAMLALEQGDPTPEDWVPHDVASYQTMYWDIETTKREFETLYDSFRGEDAFQRDFVGRSQSEFSVDVIGATMDAWGGRLSLASWFDRPAQLGRNATLGGIRLKEDHDLEEVMLKVVQKIGDNLEEKTFGGINYYAGPPFGRVSPEEDEENALPVPPMQICFGVVDDYLLIANRTDAFERGIVTRRQSSKSLKNELDFKLTASKLRRQPGGKSPGRFLFERPEEGFRVMHELATAASTRNMLESRAEDNQLLGSLHRALEDNPLPPFPVLRRYLAAAGSIITSDENGFHYTGFGLRRK